MVITLVVLGLHAAARVIPRVTVLQHHQVVQDVLLGVQVDVQVHAGAVAQVLAAVVVLPVAQPLVVVAAQVPVVVVVLPAAHLVVKVLVVVDVLPAVRENVPIHVELDVHQDVLDNVVADVHRVAPAVVKQLVQVIVLMVAIHFAVVVVIILAEEPANMFLPVHLAQDAQEPVAPIVIAPVLWRAVPAVCHAA